MSPGGGHFDVVNHQPHQRVSIASGRIKHEQVGARVRDPDGGRVFIVCASDIRQHVIKLNVKIVAEGPERLISVKKRGVIGLQLGEQSRGNTEAHGNQIYL